MMMGCRNCIPSTIITTTNEVSAGQLAASVEGVGLGKSGSCPFLLALG